MKKLGSQIFIICLICAACSDKKQELNPSLPLFQLLPSDLTGVNFRNDIIEDQFHNYLKYMYAYNGGGVAIGDINNDNLPDLLFTANMAKTQLYLNLGNMKFENITDQAGINSQGWQTGVSMVDINADGYLDIYICRSGPLQENKENLLFINQKNKKFIEQANEYGLNDAGNSCHAAFFDYDLDGDLDVYIMNHPLEFPKRYIDSNPQDTSLSPLDSDKFYRNDGGVFQAATRGAGLANRFFGLSINILDFNKDGWPDIYITSDFNEPDHLYVNQKNGTFVNQIKEKTGHISQYGMGADVADINSDGWMDIMVVDMSAEDNYRHKMMMGTMSEDNFWINVNKGHHHQFMYNTLQLNRGGLYFSEIGMYAGVSTTDWSWAPLFADFDNDGIKDLYVTNGIKRDVLDNDQRFRVAAKTNTTPGEVVNINLFEALNLYPSNKLQNYYFSGEKDFQFVNTGASMGIEDKSFSNGAAYGDLDGDGDLDLVVNNVDDEAFIYQNNQRQKTGNHYLRIKLTDQSQNIFGIGAKIKLTYGNKVIHQEIQLNHGFQSTMELVAHFGLGGAEKAEQLEIIWPDGKQQTISDIKADQTLVVKKSPTQNTMPNEIVNFKAFSSIQLKGLDFVHNEGDYNDIEFETLLPHKFSKNGPCLAIADVNGDKFNDVFIGGAAGQSGKLFLQQKDTRFISANKQPWSSDNMCEDTDALFFDADKDGDLDLYVVSGSNEYLPGSANYQDRLYLNNGKGEYHKVIDKLPQRAVSGTCVRAADYDKDGDLDLFIGASFQPKRYPYAEQNVLLRNDQGRFINVSETIAEDLGASGMVKDALWTDLNGDGDQDILLVGEWTSIQVFVQQQGAFVNQTKEFGFDNYKGWWQSIISADIDKDGDEDLIVGNIGQNYKLKASLEEPVEVFANDFDQNGTLDVVLGYYNHGKQFPVRGRNCTMEQIPDIQQKFPDYESFANAELSEVFGNDLKESLHFQATLFESIVLMNLGSGNWKKIALPPKAQFAPINTMLSYDFNHDGKMDLVGGGNLFHTEAETPRLDAGVGLCLKGNGDGTFELIEPNESGFFIPGHVKSIKRLQLADGRQSFLVGTNDEFIRIFVNL